MENSNKTVLSNYKPDKLATISRSQTRSPLMSPHSLDYNEIHSSRPIPTGPRAEKKPRLSEPLSPQTPVHSSNSHIKLDTNYPPDIKRNVGRESSPRLSKEMHNSNKRDNYKDIEDKKKRRSASPPSRQASRNHNRQRSVERNSERDRGRNHSERGRRREHERERERERDRDKYQKSTAKDVGESSKSGRRMRISGNGDRTLAERMGL